jgi:palmitoyl-protein thioesterase
MGPATTHLHNMLMAAALAWAVFTVTHTAAADAAASAPSVLPVFLMHGINTGAGSTRGLAERMREDGHLVVNLAKFGGTLSYVSLWGQAATLRRTIRSHHADPAFEHGYHLVCHSQGALVCRAVVETMDDHRVQSLVSLAGPQLGYYGNRAELYVNDWTRDYVWIFAYGSLANRMVSAASYWHDPAHEDTFRSDTHLFPYLNNLYDHGLNDEYRANLERVARVYLYGGPKDGDIAPWQSTLMGYPDASGRMVPLREQDVYTDDLIGLRALDARGALVLCEAPTTTHHQWIADDATYVTYIRPAIAAHPTAPLAAGACDSQ